MVLQGLLNEERTISENSLEEIYGRPSEIWELLKVD